MPITQGGVGLGIGWLNSWFIFSLMTARDCGIISTLLVQVKDQNRADEGDSFSTFVIRQIVNSMNCQ